MKKVVSLKHQFGKHENLVVIDWGVSNVCNYRCSYCPPQTHQGTYPFVPVEDILSFSQRVIEHYKNKLKKDVYFIYTGGEVTLFKDFIPLVKSLKESGCRVGISSNGSQKIEFWNEAKKYLEHISLSYHAEHTDLDHFIQVVNTVKSCTYTHVNIMVKPDEFEQCINAAYRIYEETDDITIDLQMVLRDFIEPYYYSDEQREIMIDVSADINGRLKLKRERDGYRGLMRLVYSDGTDELVKPGNLITRKMHSWKGWDCHIGLEMLVIDINGDIFRSWCGDDEKVGNVRDEAIKFPDTPHVCTKEWCPGGISDIMVTKINTRKQMQK